MKMMTKIIAGVALVFLATVFVSFQEGKKAWVVPEKYQKMKNPKATDKAAIELGKTLYAKHCKSCHGNVGAGDGPRAKSLGVEMDDFSSAKFQAQSDGTIYYQAIIGRDKMPNFEAKVIDEEERWGMVSYLRTLKK
jgi:mono/diheme cytochrome c family protein